MYKQQQLKRGMPKAIVGVLAMALALTLFSCGNLGGQIVTRNRTILEERAGQEANNQANAKEKERDMYVAGEAVRVSNNLDATYKAALVNLITKGQGATPSQMADAMIALTLERDKRRDQMYDDLGQEYHTWTVNANKIRLIGSIPKILNQIDMDQQAAEDELWDEAIKQANNIQTALKFRALMNQIAAQQRLNLELAKRRNEPPPVEPETVVEPEPIPEPIPDLPPSP